MVEVLDWSGRNGLRVNAIGKLAAADYGELWIPKLEEVIAEPWYSSFLFSMDEAFEAWELGATWDDMHFGFKHRNDIEKIAVVCGPRSVEWATKLGRLFG